MERGRAEEEEEGQTGVTPETPFDLFHVPEARCEEADQLSLFHQVRGWDAELVDVDGVL